MSVQRRRLARPEAGAADGVAVRDFCHVPAVDEQTTLCHEELYLTYDNGPAIRVLHPRRQGREALGPHAFEDQMPVWQNLLIEHQTGAFQTIQYGTEPETTLLIMQNESYNAVPVLAALSGTDENVETFAYCHPATNHHHARSLLPGFSTYYAITSILSYLRGSATAPKHHIYAVRLPNILELQALIEEAWKVHDINTYALTQTGGILNTRKYIATSEAETLFRLLNIPCWTMRLVSSRKRKQLAVDLLMDRIGRYFAQERHDAPLGPPPVFLHFHGHSMVVVGFEVWRKRTGSINGHEIRLPDLRELVVFKSAVSKHAKGLDEYRLSRYQLERYGAFEMIFLEDPRCWL